jgi:hypothetical protein
MGATKGDVALTRQLRTDRLIPNTRRRAVSWRPGTLDAMKFSDREGAAAHPAVA